jgi:hypothetical protein
MQLRRSRLGVRAVAAAAVAAIVLPSAAPASAVTAPPQTPRNTAPATSTTIRRVLPPAGYHGRGFVIGDSVLLGAKRCLAPLNYDIDAKGSRQPAAGASVLAATLATLPRLVVVHLGTNGGITVAGIDRIMRILGPYRRVIWVTVQLRNDYTRYRHENESNAAIRDVVNRYPNTRVADWNRVSEPHRGTYMWSDGIHLTPAGCTAFAHLVNGVARA